MMQFEPMFLSVEEVLELHTESLRRYGGTPGIRDQGLFESALGQPCASFGGEFLHTTLFEMAAAYLFHITQNHPFIDGNKRTGFACAVSFLYLNGYVLEASEESTYAMVIEVATGALDKPGIAAFLAQHCATLKAE